MRIFSIFQILDFIGGDGLVIIDNIPNPASWENSNIHPREKAQTVISTNNWKLVLRVKQQYLKLFSTLPAIALSAGNVEYTDSFSTEE